MKTNVFAISFTTTLLLSAFIIWQNYPLTAATQTPYGIISLEMACTVEKVQKIYANWHPQLTDRARVNTFIDFAYLVSYGCLLYGLVAAAARRFENTARSIGRFLSIGVLVAAFCDAVENVMILKILNGFTGKEIVATMSMFAYIKFILLAAAVIYLIAGFLYRLLYRPPIAAIS